MSDKPISIKDIRRMNRQMIRLGQKIFVDRQDSELRQIREEYIDSLPESIPVELDKKKKNRVLKRIKRIIALFSFK